MDNNTQITVTLTDEIKKELDRLKNEQFPELTDEDILHRLIEMGLNEQKNRLSKKSKKN